MRTFGYLIKAIVVVVVLFLLVKLFFPYYRVQTRSMEPTIKHGQIIVLNRFHYLMTSPKLGDIVMFRPVEGIFEKGEWSHRVIGIEGDEVNIENGIVTVNNITTHFSNINERAFVNINVPKGKVFQKGDNSNTIYGLVDIEEILGKVVLVF